MPQSSRRTAVNGSLKEGSRDIGSSTEGYVLLLDRSSSKATLRWNKVRIWWLRVGVGQMSFSSKYVDVGSFPVGGARRVH